MQLPRVDGPSDLHDRQARNVQLKNRLYARCNAAGIVNPKHISLELKVMCPTQIPNIQTDPLPRFLASRLPHVLRWAMKIIPFVSAVVLLTSSFAVAQTPPATGLIRHVAAYGYVLVVKADGSVVGWGGDESGIGGPDRPANGRVRAPLPIVLPDKARQVAVGEGGTGYALLENGTVMAWGSNRSGQLGNGAKGANGEQWTVNREPSATPVKVTGLTDVIQIEAGGTHTMALRKDGTVWVWGARDDGRLGDNSKPPNDGIRSVISLAPIAVPGLSGITQIAAGLTHSLALRNDGHVVSWGTNKQGELGNGTRITAWTPLEVSGLDHVVAIAASQESSGAVRDDGTVWMWGINEAGTAGDGTRPGAPDDPGGRMLVPTRVPGITTAKSITVSPGNVAVILGDGTIRMWGHDGWGQIGVGTSGGYHLTPMKVTGLNNKVAGVYLGSGRSFAVLADGTFWRWGFGHYFAQPSLAKDAKIPTRVDLP
jgi:alpha-tubulin suppressor-like RCC1 family protein